MSSRLPPEALSFSATKIRPPILRRGLLARSALGARIGDGLLNSPLTLVSAAGGFGKSSAVVQVLADAALGLRFAWIGCEEGDTLGRLISSLIAALEPFDLPWRVAPESLIATLDRPDGPRAFRDALVNAMAVTEGARAVIVFDDLHRVADPHVDEFLAMLPERLPRHWGLVLITRADPRWSLARLRASGNLTEIRRDALRFDVAEIESLSPSSDTARALFARTEGWPVGVSLALAGGSGAAPMRNERHALDYLRSEVLDSLPRELRDFLVKTSVLPELTATRAGQVAGSAQAEHHLDEIERRGLYYQEVDGSERTVRLHDIFRAALEAERLRLPAPERDALWRRAAETESDPVRRFDFLLAASARDAAVQTLSDEATTLIAAGMTDVVKGMLARLSAQVQADAPQIAMLRGMIAWEGMDVQGMRDHMQRAVAGFDACGDLERRDLAKAYVALAINGMSPIGNPQTDPAYEVTVDERTPWRTRLIVALHRAWHAFDLADFDTTHRHYTEVLDLLERERDAALWYQATPGVAYFGVRALEPLLVRFADGALRAAGDDYPALRAIALSVSGCIAVWRDDVARARADLDEATSLTAWTNYPQTLSIYSVVGRLMCRAAQGDLDEALAAYHAELPRIADMLGSDGRGPIWYFRWFELRCCLMAERHDLARDALAALQRETPASVALSHTGIVAIIDAYRTWLAGDLAEAASLLQRPLQHYGHHDGVGIVTSMRLQRAGLCLQTGQDACAAQALRDALDGIRLRGYPMSARFAGRGTLERLAASAAAEGLDADQRATLAAILGRLPAAPVAVPASQSQTRAAPLRLDAVSPREREVMAMLAAGDSNKIIARRLDLSPHTVKRHVANILDKLGVESRGQAAARFRELSSS